jgi:ClpP class serine protease
MQLTDLALSVPWQIAPFALEAMLSAIEGDTLDGPHALTLRPGKRREDLPGMTMRDGVAVIAIDGPIFRQADWFIRWFGGIATADLARQIQSAIDDPAVASILMVVDSPGGEATGIGELSDTIYQARAKKPVWAYVEGYGASAAYHLISAAERILIDPESRLGSIGTVLGVPDPTRRPRYTIEFVSSQSPDKRPDVTTDAGRKTMQTLVDDMTEVFIARVARNRSITPAQVMAPRGALLVGQKAIDAGLADGLGAEEQAIQALQAVGRGAARRYAGVTLTQEDLGMKISDIFSGFIKAAKDQGLEIEAEATPVSQAQPQPLNLTPEQRAAIEAATAPLQPTTTATTAQANGAADAMAKRIAELEQRIAEQWTSEIARDAAAFAQAAIRDQRAMPAEHATLVQLYLMAAQDDQAAPWPTPTEAEKGRPASRVALLQAQIAMRPQHTLIGEQIKIGAGGVLEDGAQTKMSEGRRAALLATTPLGQAALMKTTRSA